jgi:peptidoglycan/xylan/chitin deacetylase (PgdA/CDA1 family)
MYPDTIFIHYYIKDSNISTKNENIDVPILMFHNVYPWDSSFSQLAKSLTIKPEDFKLQINYLYKNRYTPLTLKELHAIWDGKEQMPTKPIVLTFDDGDSGVYKYAYPILKEYKFHFVVFLITRYTPFHTNFYMNKNEIAEMLKSGLVEVGSHTRDHINLKNSSLAKIVYEIGSSTKDIKNYLNYISTSFCYPDGRYNFFVTKTLKRFGYTMATTKTPGFASKKQNHLLLQRIRIDGRETVGTFIAKIRD